jgi:hypothetical protein
MADMMGLAIKAMGFDAAALMKQAAQLGSAFERIAQSQEAIQAALARLEAGQLAIMAGLGMDVPLPDQEMSDYIAHETQRYIASIPVVIG